jgi:hypothetical protein
MNSRMKYAIVVFVLMVSPTAWAADDGQTQPRLSSAGLLYINTTVDVISTTNGSGNVKGVSCRFVNGAGVTVHIYVNGGAAQSLALAGSDFPADFNGENFSGWIPLNVRFTSSIRVQLQKYSTSGSYWTPCMVSWALD